jgi:hypothetical protein
MTRKTSSLLSNELAIDRELGTNGYDTVKLVAENLDTLTSLEEIISGSADQVAIDAAQVALDLIATNQDTIDTAEDLVLTNADVVLTNADVVSTGDDVDLTNADVVLTNADVVLTHADVVLTNADVVLTGLDVVATNADAANLALDVQFYAHETTVPDMTVTIDAGKLFTTLLITKAQQISATITAPVTDPRIDRIAIDTATGDLVIIAGTENASPVAPSYLSTYYPICQIALAISTTEITNSLITDERVLSYGDSVKLDSLGDQNIKLHTEVIDIGDWNMDSNASVTVAHGLTHDNIRTVNALIRVDSDAGFLAYPIDVLSSGAVAGSWALFETTVQLNRITGEWFDSTNFNETSYNRGWIVIQYID